jgi:hypothetical protein
MRGYYRMKADLEGLVRKCQKKGPNREMVAQEDLVRHVCESGGYEDLGLLTDLDDDILRFGKQEFMVKKGITDQLFCAQVYTDVRRGQPVRVCAKLKGGRVVDLVAVNFLFADEVLKASA